MKKKNTWILVISIVLVVALAGGLLVGMFAGKKSDNQPGQEGQTNSQNAGNGENTTNGTAQTGDAVVTTDPTEGSEPDVPVDTTQPTTQTTTQPTVQPTTVPVEVGVDPGTEDDEIADDGVIDFEDLLAAAGKS